MRLGSVLAFAALVGACAGSPTEAEFHGDSAGGSGEGTASSLSGGTTASSTSPDGSAGDPSGGPTGDSNGDPRGDPSGDPSGDPTSDPPGDSSGDPSRDPSGDSSGDASTGTTDGSSSSSAEETAGGGGCLGAPLPDVPPQACSMESSTAADLEIENSCRYSIEVFWVDDQCEEQSYQVISGGNSWSVSSFVTHAWRIRDENSGALILEIPPLQDDTSITVQ